MQPRVLRRKDAAACKRVIFQPVLHSFSFAMMLSPGFRCHESAAPGMSNSITPEHAAPTPRPPNVRSEEEGLEHEQQVWQRKIGGR
jgi:hypothetical protein